MNADLIMRSKVRSPAVVLNQYVAADYRCHYPGWVERAQSIGADGKIASTQA
jgi:hypothetical protein